MCSISELSSGLPELWMDIGQLAAWFVAASGVMFGVIKTLSEFKNNRKLRRDELRWKQAELARQLSKEIDENHRVKLAKEMIDFSSTEIAFPESDTATTITTKIVNTALRTTNLKFRTNPPEEEIRQCFDSLFEGFEVLQSGLDEGFICFDDIEHKYSYWVSRMHSRKGVIVDYMDTFGFSLAKKFFEKFAHKGSLSSEL